MSYKIDIRNGYYGKVTTTKKGDEYVEVFEPYGRVVTVERILQPLDSIPYLLELSYCYGKDKLTYLAPRGELSEPSSCKKLADRGIDVTKRTFDAFSTSITMQENARLLDDGKSYYFETLGWINSPSIRADKTPVLCYRASKVITADGVLNSLYQGNFKIVPKGRFAEWQTMVKEHVIPYITLSIVLLCALSAVVAGILAFKISIGNGILHICGVSCSGKSTSAYVGTSVIGEPFDYAREEFDINGNLIQRVSILQSFSATDNALIGKLAGNWGVPIIIDELSKQTSEDLTNTIFNLYDGSGKTRYSKDMKITQEPGFKGTIITIGEISILDRCKKKIEGLYNRVFTLNDPLTISAEHSDAIKKCSIENNGKAAPRLAKYIIDSGGVDYVLPIYNRWRIKLRKILPKVAFRDKFIDTFPALYLTTAEIAKEALGLEFLTDSIVDYFTCYLDSNDNSMNISEKSYEYLMQEFSTNSNSFNHKKGSNEIATKGKIWGRYNKMDKLLPDGRRIVGEYLVRPDRVDELLGKKNYSKPQCIETWKGNGYISYDSDRPTRSRKIDTVKDKPEDVFVFYAFEQKEDLDDDTINP